MRKLILILLGLAIIAWLGTSTWFRVAEHEEALVLTMGRASRQVGKGVHGKLPWPFENVVVLPVRITHQMTFGYEERNGQVIPVKDEALMITGDENVVWADLVVEWKIEDIKKFVFHTEDPEWILRSATSAALRSVIGSTELDFAITTGKFEVQTQVEQQLKELMAEYDAGIHIQSVKLQDVEPPEEVKPDFQAVTDAREAMQTKQNEAGKYANEQLPKARGEAQQLIEQAEAAKTVRINQALGDVAKFKALYQAYQANPEITEKRLILETLEQILPGAEITIVDTSEGTVKYLPIAPRRGETP